MGKQVTEMLKGTLEGIVLAILSGRPAYGYEITAWLRGQGFSDIAEGTVYALLVRIEQRGLVDVEKIPSEKGPPRKVYSLFLRRHRRPAGTIPASHHAQPGHHHHDHDHADRLHAAVRLRVRRRDQLRVGFVCELPTALPGILLITIAAGISYTAFRLFLDMKSGIFERFQSMPIAQSSVLWAHVLTSVVANLISLVVVVLVALIGFRSGAGVLAWLAVADMLILFTLALTWIAVIPGLSAKSADGASAFSYPPSNHTI
jgi:hypothetical protein